MSLASTGFKIAGHVLVKHNLDATKAFNEIKDKNSDVFNRAKYYIRCFRMGQMRVKK